jgi:hypothetical protein
MFIFIKKEREKRFCKSVKNRFFMILCSCWKLETRN